MFLFCIGFILPSTILFLFYFVLGCRMKKHHNSRTMVDTQQTSKVNMYNFYRKIGKLMLYVKLTNLTHVTYSVVLLLLYLISFGPMILIRINNLFRIKILALPTLEEEYVKGNVLMLCYLSPMLNPVNSLNFKDLKLNYYFRNTSKYVSVNKSYRLINKHNSFRIAKKSQYFLKISKELQH